VAFPTETVYGLGAGVFNEAAVKRIFEAKRRPADNPLIAHIGSLEQLDQLAAEVKPFARVLIESFFPGPLTLVLKKSERVPLIATAGLDTIGVRMPKHSLAQAFLKACGMPVVAPSANISGRPSPTTWKAVYEDLNGRIDCILQGEATEIGLESTVVDCTSDRPIVLRLGGVSLSDIETVSPDVEMGGSTDGTPLRSPGLRHKHYSPKATVIITEKRDRPQPTQKSAFIGTSEWGKGFERSYIAKDVTDYAHTLFEFFRECDREGIETIYCEAVPESGIGAALMDRIKRAAHG